MGTDIFAMRKLLVGSSSLTTGQQHQVWIHPPWSIISALWSLLESSKAKGIFILPHCPTTSWFPRILHGAAKATRIVLRGEPEVYLSHGNGTRADAWQAARVDLYAVVFDFTRR